MRKTGWSAPDSYELHNPAYVAAMVWQYYLVTRDREFLRKYFPVLEEVCRFYTNISFRNPQGTFDIYHRFARGQDEASSTAGQLRNLLGASYSAEYTTRNYLAASEILGIADTSLHRRASGILHSGYTRQTLLRPEGWYATYEGDHRPLNSQKHPVQLNPVAYLPMPDLAGEGSPVELAWKNRYELTKDAKKPLTSGLDFWRIRPDFLPDEGPGPVGEGLMGDPTLSWRRSALDPVLRIQFLARMAHEQSLLFPHDGPLSGNVH